jgi:hypothetical protein
MLPSVRHELAYIRLFRTEAKWLRSSAAQNGLAKSPPIAAAVAPIFGKHAAGPIDSAEVALNDLIARAEAGKLDLVSRPCLTGISHANTIAARKNDPVLSVDFYRVSESPERSVPA